MSRRVRASLGARTHPCTRRRSSWRSRRRASPRIGISIDTLPLGRLTYCRVVETLMPFGVKTESRSVASKVAGDGAGAAEQPLGSGAAVPPPRGLVSLVLPRRPHTHGPMLAVAAGGEWSRAGSGSPASSTARAPGGRRPRRPGGRAQDREQRRPRNPLGRHPSGCCCERMGLRACTRARARAGDARVGCLAQAAP